jgi:hypothetical protein
VLRISDFGFPFLWIRGGIMGAIDDIVRRRKKAHKEKIFHGSLSDE